MVTVAQHDNSHVTARLGKICSMGGKSDLKYYDNVYVCVYTREVHVLYQSCSL